ncbi:hypothetical protein NIES4071_23370 [Calothrix sp. NIES-4071]|nr:hypothetical protein NIES4071_23370 [Calothrix sp. NIES-4071]BAZ56662.1 hypothetical protein NIES4105_23320 [Calothrix sp. NIES-4105]
MDLILEKTMSLVNYEDVDEISRKIIEIVQTIQSLSQSGKIRTLDKRSLDLLSNMFEVSNQAIKIRDIANKIEYIKDCRIYSKKFRLESYNVIPKQLLEELENLEIYSDAITQLTASQFIILSAIVYKSDTMEYLRIFYSGLSYVQQVVEKYLDYLSDKIKKSINHLVQDILANYQNSTVKANVNESIPLEEVNLLKDIKNIAKAIIYDVEHYINNPLKKFKNLDELWDYWSEIYDEDEMEETSETLIKALNETRERQGRPKLFD